MVCMDVCVDVAKDVYTLLRPGMTEEVYHDVMYTGLLQKGYACEKEYILPITMYERQTNRYLKPDIVVDGKHIIELKACAKLLDAHRYQVERYMNVMKVDGWSLLVNFGASCMEVQSCIRDGDVFTWTTLPVHIKGMGMVL